MRSRGLLLGRRRSSSRARATVTKGWRHLRCRDPSAPLTWPLAGRHEGLRIVGPHGLRVRGDNRAPLGRAGPRDRLGAAQRQPSPWRALVVPITGDKSGRWHIAFAVIPHPVAAPGTGGVVAVEGGVAVAVELSPLR